MEKTIGNISDMAEKIREIYRITRELEAACPGSKFTPDGHMVGSIGEVLAADKYQLTLLPNSTERHDARTADGKLVQIKTTQIDRVAMTSCPEYLIVIRLARDGTWEEIYNGPGKGPWEACGKKSSRTGQRHVTLAKLRKLAASVPTEQKI